MNAMDTDEAWDLGMSAFKSAFLLTANANIAIRVALDEISTKFPDSIFDEVSFTNSIVEGLKEGEIVDASYEFRPHSNYEDDFLDRFEAKLEYEKLITPFEEKARMIVIKSKMNEIVGKMSGLTDDQKKTFSVKIIELLSKNINLDEKQVKDVYAYATGLPSMIGLTADQQIEFGRKLMKLKSKQSSLSKEQIMEVYLSIVTSTNK